MNNDKLKELCNGIGMLTEIWTITYRGFKNQGMNDTDAMLNTRGFMSAMLDSFMKSGSEEEAKQ